MKKTFLLSIFLPVFIVLSFIKPALTETINCKILSFKEYQTKNFSYLLNSLDGISNNQLEQHFKLYEGYVKNVNKLNKKLKSLNTTDGNTTYSKIRSLKTARAFAHNGVVLHELYFLNLNSKQSKPSNKLKTKLIEDFGSMENYKNDLIASAKSSRGWVVTLFNYRDNKISNYIIDSHDLHVPFDSEPLLVMDVWEHAYMIDYGIERNSYINAFMKNIDWEIVSDRFEKALSK
jgi:Fe-Mn family superoxide dismutase